MQNIADTVTASPVSPETMLERLDAIIDELKTLRRVLLVQSATVPDTTSLTQRLCGVLAPPQGNKVSDVLEEYHAISEWERFI